MSGIKIIFFDLDGTLADSRQDITDAVNRTREALGIEGGKTLSEVHSYVGGGLEETIRRALADDGINACVKKYKMPEKSAGSVPRFLQSPSRRGNKALSFRCGNA